MRKRIWMVLFLAMALCFFCGNRTEAAVNTDGSVAINEENFPDERFRYLAERYDINRDAVLSMEERSVLKELMLVYNTYNNSRWSGVYCDIYLDQQGKGESVAMRWRKKEGDNAPLSVKGIEYFPKLRRYVVNGYTETEGSLQNNPELTEIIIEIADYHTDTVWPCKLKDSSRLEKEFPLKQVKKLRIGPGFECENFSLKKANGLEELSIGKNRLSDKRYNEFYRLRMVETSVLGKVDLSGCKKLKKLHFHGVKIFQGVKILQGVKIGKLDLRKNTALREIEFGGRVYLTDSTDSNRSELILEEGTMQNPESLSYPGEYPLRLEKETFRCALQLPPNNRIKKLVWMSDSDKLDLTSCRKLTLLQVPGGMDIRFNKKWYKSHGKKNMSLYVRSTKVQKKITKKAKDMVWIKTPKLSNYSPLYGSTRAYEMM